MNRAPSTGDVISISIPVDNDKESTNVVVIDIDAARRTFRFVNEADINMANPQITEATFEFAQDHGILVGCGKVSVFTFVRFDKRVSEIEE